MDLRRVAVSVLGRGLRQLSGVVGLVLLFAPEGVAIAQDCRGDLNQDGVVDGADLGVLLTTWGQCPPPNLDRGLGVTGSARAAGFIIDCMRGVDSLDVVTIGDSNTGHPANYGYTVGLQRTLGGALSLRPYATPLCAGGVELGPNARVEGMLGTGLEYRWCGDSEPGSIGTVRTLTGATASDADAIALQGNLGFSTAIPPKFIGIPWAGAFVARGVTFTSPANNNYVSLLTTNPLNSAGAALQYRVVYGKFEASGGQFRPAMWSASGSVVAPSFTSTTRIAGSWTGTASLDFTVPTPAVAVRAGWDGLSQGVPTTGPFACLWHSIVKREALGYAINPLIYDGGKTTEQIADRLEGMGGLLDAYLDELHARQVACGGSGRVLFFMNTGINGPDTPSSWTLNMDRMVARLRTRWQALGHDVNSLAFVLSVTHPTTAIPAWNAAREAVASGATDFARQQADRGVTVVDINALCPADRLLAGTTPAGSLYDSAGQAHLNFSTTQLNGYDAVTNAMLSALMAADR
jgi:hypothetical protein